VTGVYTKRLLGGIVPKGGHLTAVCPAGKTWILLDVTGGVFANSAGGYLGVNIGGTTIVFKTITVVGFDNFHWTGRAGVNAGETVEVFNGGNDAQAVIITGYEFAA
jgi:hypothetical protein